MIAPQKLKRVIAYLATAAFEWNDYPPGDSPLGIAKMFVEEINSLDVLDEKLTLAKGDLAGDPLGPLEPPRVLTAYIAFMLLVDERSDFPNTETDRTLKSVLVHAIERMPGCDLDEWY